METVTAKKRILILGGGFAGAYAWWLWRGIYLSKLPGLQKKVRVAINWTLDLIFPKDIVQLRMLGGQTLSEDEASSLMPFPDKQELSPPEGDRKRL